MNFDIEKILEDNQIIEMYFERKEEAIEYTKQKYGAICSKISNNILRNSWDAEECLNDLYIAIWNSIPPHNPRSLKAYICKLIRRISVNKVTYNNAEKRDKRKTISFEQMEAELSMTFNDDFITEDCILLTEKINEYLVKLPKQKRVVVVLRFWNSMSIKEISEQTGINVNTVKTILSRELKRMRYYFEKEGIYNA